MCKESGTDLDSSIKLLKRFIRDDIRNLKDPNFPKSIKGELRQSVIRQKGELKKATVRLKRFRKMAKKNRDYELRN